MKIKPIVTDTYDFPTLIREGYVYVDKTAYFRRLISGVDGRFFFMSRPRRFGKSLMISTLEQIFLGNRKLFNGLAIAKSNYDWKKYPVIRLDMTAFDHTSGLDQFKRSLAAEFGGIEPIAAFRDFISQSAKGSNGDGVVVLIDEYDSPVSGLLGKPRELERMREFLQSFYRILKQEAGSIRFLMMTGVSKFTKLSVFSGLNNLTDLTMEPEYSALLGYTSDELRKFFGQQIKSFAKITKRTPTAIVKELLFWYDTYRFSPKSEVCVCNPVSVGRALKSRSCEAFWDRTGSATLIIERLRKIGKLPLDVERLEVAPKRLEVCDLRDLPLPALMYQGGYLTIKSVLDNGNLVLGIPNREVRDAIYGGFLDEMLSADSDNFTSAVYDVRKVLESGTGDLSGLDKMLTAVFAMVPYEWKLKSEAEAKRYFLLFMRMAGADICVEVQSAKGRANAVLKTEKMIYIFEFKYGKSVKTALKQIKDRSYAKFYIADGRKIVEVGINYNPQTFSVEVGGSADEVVNEVVNPIDEVVNEVVKSNHGIRKPGILLQVKVSRATLERSLARLMAANRIEFRGAPKTGGYFINESIS